MSLKFSLCLAEIQVPDPDLEIGGGGGGGGWSSRPLDKVGGRPVSQKKFFSPLSLSLV